MQTIKYALLLLLVSSAFVACDKDKLQELTEGAVININTDVLNSVLSVTFANATGEEPAPKVDITVAGPDADQVFTPSGSRTFDTDDQLIDFAIKKSLELSPENPLKFSVTASAPGFRTKTVSMSITDVNTIQSATVYLIPNEGSSASAGTDEAETVTTPQVGTAEEITVTADAGRIMTATLPQGSILYNEAGTALNGNVTYELSFYDGSDRSDFLVFPTSLDEATITDAAGNVLTDRQLTVFGYYEAELTTGNATVRTMSKPVSVTMEIPEGIYNLDTETTTEAGNQVAVYVLNEAEDRWDYETMADVSEENGTLVAKFEQPHFSDFMVAHGVSPEQSNINTRVTVSSGISREDNTPGLGWELTYEDGTPIYLSGNFNDLYRFFDGQMFDIDFSSAQPLRNENVVVKVYEGPESCRGELRATSAPFFPFSTSVNVDLNSLQLDPATVEVDITVNGLCDNTSGADFRIFPSGTIHYRPEGCPNYRLLGEVNDGQFNTRALKKGASYDFLGKYDGQSFEYFDVLIESGEFDFNGELIRINTAGEVITIEYIDVPVPTEYCDLFG